MTQQAPTRAFSYGGGVQSTAALVLAAHHHIDFPTFIFANVGDNAENPDTLDYVHSIAMPFAERHGIDLLEIRKEWRDGRGWTLWDKLIHSERSIGIPVRLEGSGAPARRNCTQDFKIKPIAKWLKQHGASATHLATIGLGISLDEFRRMRTDSGFDHYTLEYPLITRRLDRSNCIAIIERAGLPVPPKSSCFFCPYHTLATWRAMKQEQPGLFAQAVSLEQTLSQRGEAIGTGKVYMTDKLTPLPQAVGSGTQQALTEDTCESGFCMT